MVNKSTQDQTPARSRSKTLAALDKVIDGLVAGNEKLSIASVARAAGVTPGLIHNTYPAVAEKFALSWASRCAPSETRSTKH